MRKNIYIFIKKTISLYLAAALLCTAVLPSFAQLLNESGSADNFAAFGYKGYPSFQEQMEEAGRRLSESYEKSAGDANSIWTSQLKTPLDAKTRASEIRKIVTGQGYTKEELAKIEETRKSSSPVSFPAYAQYKQDFIRARESERKQADREFTAEDAEVQLYLNTQGSAEDWEIYRSWKEENASNIAAWYRDSVSDDEIKKAYAADKKEYDAWLASYEKSEEQETQTYIKALAKSMVELYKVYGSGDPKFFKAALLDIVPAIAQMETNDIKYFAPEDRILIRSLYRDLIKTSKSCDWVTVREQKGTLTGYVKGFGDVPSPVYEYKIIREGLRDEAECDRVFSAVFVLSFFGESGGSSCNGSSDSDACAIYSFMKANRKTSLAVNSMHLGAAALLAMRAYTPLQQFVNEAWEDEDHSASAGNKYFFDGIKSYYGKISSGYSYKNGDIIGNSWEDLAYALAEDGSRGALNILATAYKAFNGNDTPKGIHPFTVGALLSGKLNADGFNVDERAFAGYFEQGFKMPPATADPMISAVTGPNSLRSEPLESPAAKKTKTFGELLKINKAAAMAYFFYESGLSDMDMPSKQALDSKLSKYYAQNLAKAGSAGEKYKNLVSAYSASSPLYREKDGLRDAAKVADIILFVGSVAVTIYLLPGTVALIGRMAVGVGRGAAFAGRVAVGEWRLVYQIPKLVRAGASAERIAAVKTASGTISAALKFNRNAAAAGRALANAPKAIGRGIVGAPALMGRNVREYKAIRYLARKNDMGFMEYMKANRQYRGVMEAGRSMEMVEGAAAGQYFSAGHYTAAKHGADMGRIAGDIRQAQTLGIRSLASGGQIPSYVSEAEYGAYASYLADGHRQASLAARAGRVNPERMLGGGGNLESALAKVNEFNKAKAAPYTLPREMLYKEANPGLLGMAQNSAAVKDYRFFNKFYKEAADKGYKFIFKENGGVLISENMPFHPFGYAANSRQLLISKPLYRPIGAQAGAGAGDMNAAFTTAKAAGIAAKTGERSLALIGKTLGSVKVVPHAPLPGLKQIFAMPSSLGFSALAAGSFTPLTIPARNIRISSGAGEFSESERELLRRVPETDDDLFGLNILYALDKALTRTVARHMSAYGSASLADEKFKLDYFTKAALLVDESMEVEEASKGLLIESLRRGIFDFDSPVVGNIRGFNTERIKESTLKLSNGDFNGSGVFIKYKGRPFILTNKHVAEGFGSFKITDGNLSGGWVGATVEKSLRSSVFDLALLKPSKSFIKNHEPASFGEFYEIPGRMLSAGFPSWTKYFRMAEVFPLNVFAPQRGLVSLTAGSVPGMSGGGVFDLEGKIVGINQSAGKIGMISDYLFMQMNMIPLLEIDKFLQGVFSSKFFFFDAFPRGGAINQMKTSGLAPQPGSEVEAAPPPAKEKHYSYGEPFYKRVNAERAPKTYEDLDAADDDMGLIALKLEMAQERRALRGAWEHVLDNPLRGKKEDILAEINAGGAKFLIQRGGITEQGYSGDYIVQGPVLARSAGGYNNFGLNKVVYKHALNETSVNSLPVTRDDFIMLPKYLREIKPYIGDYNRLIFEAPAEGGNIRAVFGSYRKQRNKYTLITMYRLPGSTAPAKAPGGAPLSLNGGNTVLTSGFAPKEDFSPAVMDFFTYGRKPLPNILGNYMSGLSVADEKILTNNLIDAYSHSKEYLISPYIFAMKNMPAGKKVNLISFFYENPEAKQYLIAQIRAHKRLPDIFYNKKELDSVKILPPSYFREAFGKTLSRLSVLAGKVAEDSYVKNFVEISNIFNSIDDFSFDYGYNYNLSAETKKSLKINFDLLRKTIKEDGLKADPQELNRIWFGDVSGSFSDGTLLTMSLDDYFKQIVNTKFSEGRTPNFIVSSKKWTDIENAAIHAPGKQHFIPGAELSWLKNPLAKALIAIELGNPSLYMSLEDYAKYSISGAKGGAFGAETYLGDEFDLTQEVINKTQTTGIKFCSIEKKDGIYGTGEWSNYNDVNRYCDGYLNLKTYMPVFFNGNIHMARSDYNLRYINDRLPGDPMALRARKFYLDIPDDARALVFPSAEASVLRDSMPSVIATAKKQGGAMARWLAYGLYPPKFANGQWYVDRRAVYLERAISPRARPWFEEADINNYKMTLFKPGENPKIKFSEKFFGERAEEVINPEPPSDNGVGAASSSPSARASGGGESGIEQEPMAFNLINRAKRNLFNLPSGKEDFNLAINETRRVFFTSVEEFWPEADFADLLNPLFLEKTLAAVKLSIQRSKLTNRDKELFSKSVQSGLAGWNKEIIGDISGFNLERAKESGVRIMVKNPGGGFAYAGSGIFTTAPNGAQVILTNRHVLEGSKELKLVDPSMREYSGELLYAGQGMSEAKDIAVIIPSQDYILRHKPVELSNSIKTPRRMLSTGYPGGMGNFFRTAEIKAFPSMADNGVYFTTSSVLPGMSGGGVFTQDGKLAGLNVGSLLVSKDIKSLSLGSFVISAPAINLFLGDVFSPSVFPSLMKRPLFLKPAAAQNFLLSREFKANASALNSEVEESKMLKDYSDRLDAIFNTAVVNYFPNGDIDYFNKNFREDLLRSLSSYVYISDMEYEQKASLAESLKRGIIDFDKETTGSMYGFDTSLPRVAVVKLSGMRKVKNPKPGGKEFSEASGSGVFVSVKGHPPFILTNRHVARDLDEVMITDDNLAESWHGSVYAMGIGGVDEDLAIIIPPDDFIKTHKPVEISDSNTEPDRLLSAGFPGRLGFLKMVELNTMPFNNPNKGLYMRSGGLLPGMSGGGVFDTAGKLAGLNVTSFLFDNDHSFFSLSSNIISAPSIRTFLNDIFPLAGLKAAPSVEGAQQGQLLKEDTGFSNVSSEKKPPLAPADTDGKMQNLLDTYVVSPEFKASAERLSKSFQTNEMLPLSEAYTLAKIVEGSFNSVRSRYFSNGEVDYLNPFFRSDLLKTSIASVIASKVFDKPGKEALINSFIRGINDFDKQYVGNLSGFNMNPARYASVRVKVKTPAANPGNGQEELLEYSGSGVFVSAGKYPPFILTSRHLLENSRDIRIYDETSENSWEASLFALGGSSAAEDMAIIMPDIGFTKTHKPVPLSSAGSMPQRMFSIGFPSPSIKIAEIKPLDFIEGPGGLMSTSGGIMHGMSGGGVFDTAGKLVGVNARAGFFAGDNSLFSNSGYIVPLHSVRKFINGAFEAHAARKAEELDKKLKAVSMGLYSYLYDLNRNRKPTMPQWHINKQMSELSSMVGSNKRFLPASSFLRYKEKLTSMQSNYYPFGAPWYKLDLLMDKYEARADINKEILAGIKKFKPARDITVRDAFAPALPQNAIKNILEGKAAIIIDDDQERIDIKQALGGYFTDIYETKNYTGVEEFIERYGADNIVVFSDIRLDESKLNSLDVLGKIKQISPEIPVIAAGKDYEITRPELFIRMGYEGTITPLGFRGEVKKNHLELYPQLVAAALYASSKPLSEQAFLKTVLTADEIAAIKFFEADYWAAAPEEAEKNFALLREAQAKLFKVKEKNSNIEYYDARLLNIYDEAEAFVAKNK